MPSYISSENAGSQEKMLVAAFCNTSIFTCIQISDATNRTIELFKIPRALASGGGHPPPLIQLN